jgi:hypothetical protein
MVLISRSRAFTLASWSARSALSSGVRNNKPAFLAFRAARLQAQRACLKVYLGALVSVSPSLGTRQPYRKAIVMTRARSTGSAALTDSNWSRSKKP